MSAYENNAYFWQKLDTLLLSSKLVIDRPKNTSHHKYSNLIYPVDYGYLTDTINSDLAPIDVFKGTKKSHLVNVIAICADILKKDVEVKLLLGCTPEEETLILEFLNQTEFQKCVLIRRGNEVPSWGTKE